jgi:hypothetical protein
MHRLAILGVCATLVGCSAAPPVTRQAPNSRTSHSIDPEFATLPWRWEDYSNRVWIAVAGVGLEVGRSNALKRVSFSYSPNTGRSKEEAIAIRSFDAFSGRRAEHLLLRVLFGAAHNPLSYSSAVSGGKAFHIYSFTDETGQTNTVYFDGTKYHNLL